MKNGTCLFCECSIETNEEGSTEIIYCQCENCGVYRTSFETFGDLPNERVYISNKDKNYLLSGYFREMTDLKLKPEIITVENYESLFNNSMIPKSLYDKLNKLLLHINRRTNYFSQEISIDLGQPAIAYAKNQDELTGLIKALQELKYLSPDFNIIYGTNKVTGADNITSELQLTTEGLKKAEALQKEITHSKQGFVAMWFTKDLEYIYDDYISKAIQDAGFEPCIIRNVEHNEDICDEIIAQIRKSKFLIADTTGHRNGVYYEAGFAYGLGLPVIWACREDYFEDTHFDVNHNSFIVWETGEELYQKLKNRIMATVI